ncbi:type II toxin-antitoxin system VapB family antitoxin [Caulobacter sp. Root1472]|jgi:antitoxin VapB|uniref:type II toxin-antitoxin system VapB family antitoxin n=2 Tax=Caulobacter TaxID=75 RepID=UPI0006F8C8CB|nr:type II toxin-antitoxin system VapB family antitoxin [Caulobacter sp. Root1472]KQZ28831.1 transcription factor [Caulobacter sp. Root1472]
MGAEDTLSGRSLSVYTAVYTETGMGILIKNPEAERAVRELAELTGESLTTAVEVAVKERLEAKRAAAPRHKPRSVAEMDAITWKYLTPEARAGLIPPITKADFDEINEIPGLDDE